MLGQWKIPPEDIEFESCKDIHDLGLIDPKDKGLFKQIKEVKDDYLRINWRGLRDKKFYIRGADVLGTGVPYVNIDVVTSINEDAYISKDVQVEGTIFTNISINSVSYIRLVYNGCNINASSVSHTINNFSLSPGMFVEFIWDPYGTGSWLLER